MRYMYLSFSESPFYWFQILNGRISFSFIIFTSFPLLFELMVDYSIRNSKWITRSTLFNFVHKTNVIAIDLSKNTAT